MYKSKYSITKSKQSSKSKFVNIKESRVVKILEIFPNDVGTGYFLCEEVDTNKHFKVTISLETYKNALEREKMREEEKEKPPFKGYIIDNDFKAKFSKAQSAYAVLIATEYKPVKKTIIDDIAYTEIECSWIREAPQFSAGKIFKAPFSVSSYNSAFTSHITNVQVWNLEAIDCNDTEKANNFCDEIDSIAEETTEKYQAYLKAKEKSDDVRITFPLRKGFFMRAIKTYLVETENSDGKLEEKYKYEVFDYTTPFTSSAIDEETGKRGVLTGDDVADIIKGYFDYIVDYYNLYKAKYLSTKENDVYLFDYTEEDLKEPNQKVIEEGKPKLIIEIVPFTIYNCSQNNKNNLIYTDENKTELTALGRLLMKETKTSADMPPEEYVEGYYNCVNSVVQIVKDVLDDNTGEKIINNRVSRVDLYGQRRNVNHFVKTSKGNWCSVSPELKTEEEIERIAYYQAKKENSTIAKKDEDDIKELNSLVGDLDEDTIL